jgi:hypothetical protein
MGRGNKDELIASERRFLIHYVQSGNATDAYRKTFPKKKLTDGSAATLGWKLVGRIRKILGDSWWDEFGLTDAEIARVFREGMEATLIKPMAIDKCLVEAGPYTDHPTRIRAGEVAAKLKGRFVEKHELTGPGGGPIQHALEEMSEEELASFIRRGRFGPGKGEAD